jgi:hypothetical protein
VTAANPGNAVEHNHSHTQQNGSNQRKVEPSSSAGFGLEDNYKETIAKTRPGFAKIRRKIGLRNWAYRTAFMFLFIHA